MKPYNRRREAGNDMERRTHNIGDNVRVTTFRDNTVHIKYGLYDSVPLTGDEAKDLAELITTGKITPKWTDAKVISTLNVEPQRYFLRRSSDLWTSPDGWCHSTEELTQRYGADGLFGVDS